MLVVSYDPLMVFAAVLVAVLAMFATACGDAMESPFGMTEEIAAADAASTTTVAPDDGSAAAEGGDDVDDD